MYSVFDTIETTKKYLYRLYYNYNMGQSISINLKNIHYSDDNTSEIVTSLSTSPVSNISDTLPKIHSCENFKYKNECNCYNKIQSDLSEESLENNIIKCNSENNMLKIINLNPN